MNQREIRAVYDDNTIRVYQAYCKKIADEAVRSGTFGKRFKEAVRKYVNEWIVNIEDITKYVTELRKKRDGGKDISGLLPAEKVYKFEEQF